jgi:hypothetical protein
MNLYIPQSATDHVVDTTDDRRQTTDDRQQTTDQIVDITDDVIYHIEEVIESKDVTTLPKHPVSYAMHHTRTTQDVVRYSIDRTIIKPHNDINYRSYIKPDFFEFGLENRQCL